jgi:hypothetical protein
MDRARFSRIFSGSQQDPQTIVANNRVSAIAGYGYSLSQSQQSLLDSRVKLFRNNGGLPNWYLHSELSVNINIFNTTATLSTQTVALAVGAYTFNFASGAGSITSSNSTGVASNHGAVTVGISRTITVSVAGNFTFTVSGVVNNAQLEAGSTATTYIARSDNTTVKVLNLGNLNATGDSSYTNGANGNMQGFQTPVKTMQFVATSSQSLLSDITQYYPDFTFIIAIKPSILSTGRFFRKGTSQDRLSSLADGTLQFNSTTGAIGSSPAVITTGSWQIYGFSTSGITASLFKNGSQLTPLFNTLTVRDTDATQPYSISGPDTFLSADIGEVIMIPANLTPAQHLAIYNGIKATYGL